MQSRRANATVELERVVVAIMLSLHLQQIQIPVDRRV